MAALWIYAAWYDPPGVRTQVGEKRLWRCPSCGHRFVTQNLWHSCGRFRIKDHFDGKSPELYQIFKRFVAIARTCGPVTVYAQKTRIVLQARVRFAAVRVCKNWIDAGIWLRRRAKHRRITRVESFGNLGYGHNFRLCNVLEVDEAIPRFLREAYSAGRQGSLSHARR